MFGLYDAGGVTDDRAAEKEVMHMYKLHWREIQQYERDYRPPSGIFNQIADARINLITKFGEGRDIEAIIVGKGLPTYLYKDGTPNDEGEQFFSRHILE